MTGQDAYQELFDRSPDAILIIEGDRFVDCNPAAVRMLRFPDKAALLSRYSGSDVLSAHPADLSPPTQPDGESSFEKAERHIAIAFERGSYTFEWTHVCADGDHLLVEVQLTVVRRGEQPVLHVVWRDISERKQLEEELRRAQRLEAVGRLAGGVAHDFNNLLVVILSHAELLGEEIDAGKPTHEHVDGIREAADRAADLTRQLLAFSRGQPAQSRPTDLGALLDRLGPLLHRLIGEHIDLEIERGDEALVVFADPSQLEQVVVNLAANARDAMPSGGRLRIAVKGLALGRDEAPSDLDAGRYVELQVVDDGTGMTSEELDHAFDPFYTTKQIGQGTGLGLATVHAIAEQNHGRASIESQTGRGTTVRVLLPQSAEAAAEERKAPRPRREAPRGGETILLVEDQRPIRDLFRRGLEGQGYRVLTAEDGRQALDVVGDAAGPVDLVVSDVVMPRMSGPELVRRLAPSQPEMRVLFMSGYSDEGDLGLMSDGERAAVLQKPFTGQKLFAEVRRILDAR